MSPSLPLRFAFTGVWILFAGPSLQAEDAQLTYERDVRPIFKAHCFHCHGEGEELSGGLDLRLRRLIAKGGDSGPAIDEQDIEQSPLLTRLLDGDMPPEDAVIRPTDAEIEQVRRWVLTGGNTSRDEPADLDPSNYITEEERSFWAFQPIERPPIPNKSVPSDSIRGEEVNGLARTPVDRFVARRLRQQGLEFSQHASPSTLIRRAYFDLLGLPPNESEIAAFVADGTPDAYERLIERLLSSPRYGEQWGRHWLDVVGYADSEGYTEDDVVRPYAYKYRDYVIDALNADKSYAEFVVEQLAGDELIEPPFENLNDEQISQLVATGFLRMAPDGTGGSVDQPTARKAVMSKTIEIVSTSLLGLTVGCAECHNHRYDPISQEDYYALRAVFEPALDSKNWLAPSKRRVSLYTDADRAKAAKIEAEAKEILDERAAKQKEFIEATFEKELAKLPEELQEPVALARNTPDKERTDEQKRLLREHPSVNVSAGSLYLYDKKAADALKEMADRAEAIRKQKPKEEFVRATWEAPSQELPKTFVFHRGDHDQLRQEVKPRELTVLTSFRSVELPTDDDELTTSGRRLAYARWLTSGDHPLLARVIVNRIWLNHFGQGLVPSPGDFGALGERPSHPELLDWLACELVDHNWSIKHIHRLIMRSTTYRQASTRRATAEQIDSNNQLYWRMPVRRLSAENIRDAMLAVSGELNCKAGGPAAPVMADRVGQFVVGKENLNAGRPGAVIPMNGEELRRSVYIESRRSRPLSVLAPFDLPRMEPNCTARASSTVSPQSLMMMNSDFVLQRARSFAARVQHEAGEGLGDQIAWAWYSAMGRPPTFNEVADASAFLLNQAAVFEDQPKTDKSAAADSPQLRALSSLCHALLSSNAFLYVD